MRRALLLFNPEATSVSARVRDVIAHALAAELKLEIAETKRRHHATHLARGAAHDEFDLVCCLGGDGTVNEVVNGLVGTDVPLVPLPGGGTNVFARTLGLPKDPIEATSILLERIAAGAQPRRISLGRVNGRAFAFCAGIGFDAAIVRGVERRPRLKQRFGEALFVGLGLQTFFFGFPRRDGPLTVHAPGGDITGARTAIVCNSDPYTFLGARPFRLCPDASHEGGLEAIAFRKLPTIGSIRVVLSAFGRARHERYRHVRMVHDAASFTITAARPLPYQVDGDDAGDAESFAFESLPGALTVLS